MEEKINTKLFGYKGFSKNLTCQGFQYKEGETYEHEGKIQLCFTGFHFCTEPADTLYYYPLERSKYGTVMVEEISNETSEMNSKRVAKKIKIIKIHDNLEWAKLLLNYYRTCPPNPRLITIDKKDFEKPDKIIVDVDRKVVIMKKDYYNKITIKGEDNVIIIPDDIYINKLVVIGKTNSVINLKENITIRVIDIGNNILNIASKVKLKIDGDYNTIINNNEGGSVKSIIVGNENKYKGKNGDKISFIRILNEKSSKPEFKNTKITIGKKFLPNIYHKTEEIVKL